MTKRITPPDWNQWDKNMFIIVDDMRLYYENFTAVVDDATKTNATAIDGLDSRVTALEHNKPIGPGGDGAFLALGGVPSDYPTKAQMTGPDGKETSYLVVARNDGIYFYNPVTKDLMVPKTNGGRIAINAQFPQTFDTTHEAKHNGRQSISGFYTADVKTLGLETQFTTHDICKMLVVVADTGVEYQTAFHADGIASRYFLAGQPASTWSIVGGGSGSGVGPGIIQDLTDRIVELEKYNHNNTNFINLDDTPTSYNGHQFKAVTVRGDEMGVEFTPIVTKDVYDAEILNQRAIDKQHDDHVKRIDSVLANNEVRIDGIEKAIPNHTDRLDAHEIRIAAIEIGGGGGGSADIGPLLVRLTALEDEDKIHGNRLDAIDMVNNDQDNTLIDHADQLMEHEDRIELLENSPSIPTDLLDRVDDIEAKNIEQDDRLDALEATPPSGGDVTKVNLLTGDLPINQKGIYNESMVNWDHASQSDIAKSPVFHFWGNSTGKVVNLPDIVAGNTDPLPSNAVRVGRLTIIANKSTTNKSIKVQNGCLFYGLGATGNDTSGTEWTLKPGCVAVLNPIITGAEKRWCLIGSLLGDHLADFNGLVSRVSALENNNVYIGTSNIWAAAGKYYKVVVQQSSAANLQLWLQDIKTYSETIGTNDIYQGIQKILVNQNTNSTSIKAFPTSKLKLPDGSMVETLELKGGHAVEVIGEVSSTERYWRVLNIGPIDNTAPTSSVSNFTDLADTPTNYTGHGEKLVVVKADESGLEFIEHGDITDYGDRIQDLEDNMAEHLLDFEMMGDGHIETSWNGLGAPSLSTLNDVTAENIATSPFCVAQGSVAGKKFTMPNIVAKDTKGLGATDVREGRTTYLINLSTVPRKVQVSAGCKFNMTGGAVTTDQEIPRKTVWMFSPTLAAGDKVWVFIGVMSVENIDIKQLIDRLTALETEIAKTPLSSKVEHKVLTSSSNVQSATIGDKDVVIQELLSSSNPIIWLPIIVERTTTPANNQCWVGKRYVFINRGDIDTKMNTTGTAVITLPDRTTTTSLTLKKGNSVEFVTAGDSTNGVWTMVRMGPIDDSTPPPATFKDLTDTPSGYTPNQVLRYNQAGTAVISTAFDFKNLVDTPSTYSGHKNKMLVVNNGETAIEFKNVPDTSGLQTEIDNNHNAIIALQNMDTVINGKVDTLETDVADIDGRVTTLEAGGSTADFVTKTSLVDGTAVIEGSKIGSYTGVDWNSVGQGQAAGRPAIFFWGNSAGKFVTLPDIVARDSDTVPSNAVRMGRVMYISNRSTTNKTIKVANGCLFNSGGNPVTTSSADYTLLPGTTATLFAHLDGADKHWIFLGVFTADQTKTVTFADVEANTDWRTKVETGDSSGKVNSNCVYGAMQIKDGDLSATELATCSAGYIIGSTARTCTLPRIKDVNVANLGADEARFGKQIRMVNMSTQNMTLSVLGGGRIYKPDNTWTGTVTLAPQKFADFHAVWWPGGGFNNFAWVMMVP